MYCSECGKDVGEGTHFCPGCGTAMAGAPPPLPQYGGARSNCGLCGFITALIGLFLPVPFVDILIAAAGVILSGIGISTRKYRGLAIAGLIIGIVAVIGNISLVLTQPEVYTDAWEPWGF